jgi:GTPase
MKKETLLHIGIVIVIAILLFLLVTKIIDKINNNKLDKVGEHKTIIENRVDSIVVENIKLDSLNKKDGVQVKKIKEHIPEIDSVVNNANVSELSKLLYKHSN